MNGRAEEGVSLERWQEYDCPVTGIDFDLDAMVCQGDAFDCPGCRGTHVATPELVTQYERDERGTRMVPLQVRA